MRMLTRHARRVFGSSWENQKEDITCLDVTPVEKWIERSGSLPSVMDDMAQIVPPWPQVWVEYVPQNDVAKRVGASLFSGFEGPVVPFGIDHIDEISVDQEEVSGSVVATLYLENKCEQILEVGHYITLLNEEGFALTSTGLCKPSDQLIRLQGNITNKELQGLFVAAKPILFGISLCHANNVELYEDEVPAPVQKKRRKSGKNPGKTFKCLDIEPMKKKSRRESEEGESDVERALHICRGHFKTYTEENPLFGQHTGTYWWPMHVRGSEEQGEVEKSYQVNQPE